MKLARIAAFLVAAGILVGAASSTYSEEITLKDGHKISGTIIGYEQGMFRIETDFGIALVRKDRVVSIQVTKPEASTTTAPAPKTVEAKPPHAPDLPKAPAPSPKLMVPLASAQTPPPQAARRPSASAVTATPPVNPPSVPSPPSAPTHMLDQPSTIQPQFTKPGAPIAAVAQPVPPPARPKPLAPPPPPISHPLDVQLPTHLQEHLDGNTYTNDTFQFSMYKPPDWKVFEGLPRETSSGIMAMGTEDEQTLVMVDRQVWSGAPKLTSSEAEAKLRQTYQEYRLNSDEPFVCDGKTATRRTFTGILEGVEWHGIAIHVIEGNTVFGITGLTAAETYQFQEAIFNKIFKTLHFQITPVPAAASPKP